MMEMNKQGILTLIQKDEKMMEIITAASTLNLPDWWVCAGFVRSKIWDVLHGYHDRSAIPDVDVIYFDSKNIAEETEKELEAKLKLMMPGIPWSVKNQARMHVVNNLPPYTSAEDGIAKFPETATALGVKLDKDNNLVLTAPWGVEDVLQLELKPTPFFTGNKALAAIYEERLVKKNWVSVWPKVKVHHI